MIPRLLRIIRIEYYSGLWIAAVATFILWYSPERSPNFTVILWMLLFSSSLYVSGFVANSYADAAIEINYQNYKKDVAEAVGQVGNKGVRALLIAIILFGIGASIWTSILLSSLTPVFLAILGLITGVGYSLPPLRWKERGFLLHTLALSFSAFFLPLFLIGGTLLGGFDLRLAAFCAGYAIAHYGMEIGNQLLDMEEDEKFGIFTLPSPSLKTTVLVGAIFILAGILIAFFSYQAIFLLLGWQLVVVLLVLFLSYLAPLNFYLQTYLLDQPRHEIPTKINYPHWQVWSMVGYLAIALLVRFLGGGLLI